MRIYLDNKDEAERIAEDYRFLGYRAVVGDGHLTVTWGPEKKKKVEEKSDKPERNKRLDRRPRD